MFVKLNQGSLVEFEYRLMLTSGLCYDVLIELRPYHNNLPQYVSMLFKPYSTERVQKSSLSIQDFTEICNLCEDIVAMHIKKDEDAIRECLDWGTSLSVYSE